MKSNREVEDGRNRLGLGAPTCEKVTPDQVPKHGVHPKMTLKTQHFSRYLLIFCRFCSSSPPVLSMIPGANGVSGTTPQSPGEASAGHSFMESPWPDVLERRKYADALLGAFRVGMVVLSNSSLDFSYCIIGT